MRKSEQIESLRRCVPSAVSRSPEDTVFDVGIRLSEQKILTMRIELPVDFPRSAPVLRIIDPGATHDWLDSSGRVVGVSELYNWTERTSVLGDVVQKTLAAFCTRPPHINPALARRPSSNWTQPVQTPAPSRTRLNNDTSQQLIQLNVPESFPEIEKYDQKQLQDLLENEATFVKLFESLNVVNNALQLRDSLKQSNAQKARENIRANEEANALYQSLIPLNRSLNEVRQEFEQLLEQYSSATTPLDPRQICDGLDLLARQTDNASEELARQILFDDVASVESNLTKYRELRVKYHLRRAKAERCRSQFSN